MKTVHTIQLNNCTETRTSKTHVYGACVVSTVTRQVVDAAEANLVALKANVEVLTPMVARMQAKLGMTVAEAEKLHEERTTAWFHIVIDVERELREKSGRPYANVDRDVARKIAVERGNVDPYTLPESKFLEAVRELQTSTRAIKEHRTPAVGDQCVLAWSRDAGLALKVKNSYRERAAQGYAITVRTDITTK